MYEHSDLVHQSFPSEGANHQRLMGMTVRKNLDNTEHSMDNFDYWNRQVDNPNTGPIEKNFYQKRIDNYGSRPITNQDDTYTPSSNSDGWNRQI